MCKGVGRFVLVTALVGALATMACGDGLGPRNPDGGLGHGSSANTSGDGGDGGDGGSGKGLPNGGRAGEVVDASTSAPVTLGMPCLVSADCVDADLCNGTESCLGGHCQAGMPLTCSDGDPCTVDTCTPATGICSLAAVPNGMACLGASRCDGQLCLDGVCTATPPVLCADDGNPCTVEACDALTGACVSSLAPAGQSCEDGNRCNGAETCSNGGCMAGVATRCDDGNRCTVDSCNPATGCSYVTSPDGSSCSDGNLCNGAEICTLGTCLPGTPASCDDSSLCTTDACNPATGACSFTNLPDGTACPDADRCDGQRCISGACVSGAPIACAGDADNNRCTANICVPSTGLCAHANVRDGTACNDVNLCNGTETCRGGQCSVSGTPLTCADDGNPCTTAVCNPAWGCLQMNVPNGTFCADADLCDGAETCTAGVCSSSGVAVVCDDANPCTTNACNSTTGSCAFTPVPNGTFCADADLCDGSETCTAGVCSASGVAVSCDDANPCTTNACNPTTGACAFTPVPNGTSCADADLCDGTETCTSGTCSPSGVAVVCDDANRCTTNACDPVTGACLFPGVPNGTSCADADLCNGTESCSAGACVAGAPVLCTLPQTCSSATGTCVP